MAVVPLFPWAFCTLTSAGAGENPWEENWLNREDSEDFSRLTEYRDGYRAGARRFDMGQASNFVLMPMASQALSLMAGWGAASRGPDPRTHDRPAGQGPERPSGSRPRPQGERAPHMVGLRLARGSAPALAQALAREQVYVSARGQEHYALAPHVYTTPEDLDRFISMLARSLST